MKDGAQGLRTIIGRMATPDEYELIKAQPKSPHRMPMSWDQPNFVFSDEEDGVVALKNGKEILFASLYWRARFGINNLARIHYLTPQFDRIAVVREQTQFEPSGNEFTWPNWTNMAFGNGGLKYPGDLQSAYAGEKQPVARFPEGVPFTPQKESPYAGRGDFYTLQYGPYLIGLNMSQEKSFELHVPAEAPASTVNLVDRRPAKAGSTITVAPKTTAVLYLGHQAGE